MRIVFRDCIDYGSEYCPCKLAESGKCILCSQLSGKDFCDCTNWKGVCIYHEFIMNGKRARPAREWIRGKITEKIIIDKGIFQFSIKLPDRYIDNIKSPGSYVFIKKPDSDIYFNLPISVMDIGKDGALIIVIEIKGVKSEVINELKEEDYILVKGPYWNGILGLDNLMKCRDSNVLLIGRGIGQAPLVPVLKQLIKNGNTVKCLIDKSPYNKIFIDEYLNKYEIQFVECGFMDEVGELTEVLDAYIKKYIKEDNLALVHCSGPDILIYRLYDTLKKFGMSTLSCSNNGKFCCGEGICGSCSTKNKYFKIERACKLQTDPIDILEGRRRL